MSAYEIFLWPVVGFLLVAAFATSRQARDPRSGRRRSLVLGGLALAILVFLLSACAATQSPAMVAPAAPGFWLGLWHGFIFPIAWILSLFVPDVAIYAVPNNGGWYDFGYFVGIVFIGVGARKSHTVYRDRIVHVPLKDVTPVRESKE